MVWVTITGAGVTTAVKFFGDVMNKINNMFNGVAIGDTVLINSAVVWTFQSNALRASNINDSNGNEVISLGSVGSAVNQVQITNSIVSNPVLISAIGGDTNINLQLSGKGTGVAKGVRETIMIAISDETTDLTTGTAKVTYRMPYAFTLLSVKGSVTTAPTGTGITIDINDSGSTIMTTDKIEIDAGTFSSDAAAIQPALTDTALANDAQITIDIDIIGSTIAGTGAKVYLIGFQP